jgi:hypothetical protein
MLTRPSIRTGLLLAGTVFLSSCLKDQVTERYTFFRPVYRTKAEVRSEARSAAPVAVSNPGKLFIKGGYVFLNEVDRGIHVIDFSQPTAPKNIAFIKIPGCVDMAVRGNHLYADCYTDLVSMDITDPRQVVVKHFVEGVFPHRRFGNGFVADTNLVITEWKRVDTVVRSRAGAGMGWGDPRVLSFSDMRAATGSAMSSPGVTNGVGGSMARFGLLDDRLYTVSWSDLKVFNTADPSKPVYTRTISLIQGDIETIFPYRNRLFLGSQTGMFIYDASNKDNPTRLGQFTHARACDPVVADDTHAFVTLRSGGPCAGNINQLDVIDVTSLTSPKLVKTYPMKGPAGLSKDGNLLFVCDGSDGLKIYDAARPDNLVLLKTIPLADTYDVIAWNRIALTVAKDGIHFIDYTNPQQAFVAGKIVISKS